MAKVGATPFQPRTGLPTQPIQSLEFALERLYFLNSAVRPLGLNEPVAGASNNYEDWLTHRQKTLVHSRRHVVICP
jgi:hypothetical protein